MAADTPWGQLAHEALKELKGAGADKARGRAAVHEFTDWAEKVQLEYPLPLEVQPTKLVELEAALEHYKSEKDGSLTKSGQAVLQWGTELMRRSRNPQPASVTGAVEPEEEDMAKRGEEEDLEQDGEEFEGEEEEAELDDEGDEEEEAPPPPRKRRAPQPPIIVQVPRGAVGGGRKSASSAAAPRKGLIERPTKVRVFKRDERGKRVLVDDYSREDLGNMKLEAFLANVVHPRFMNDGIDTEYLVYDVDPRTDAERGAPAGFTFEADEDDAPQGNSNDPFQMVSKAMSMVKQLRGEPEEAPQQDPALMDMRKRAAQNGDMNGVITMMLLDRMMNAQKPQGDTELLMKILDRLEGKQRGQPEWPQQPPPWAMPPPPPPPQSSAVDKVMELAMAKMLQPPPSLFEQAKEMASLQQVLGTGGPQKPGSSELEALRAEVAALRGSVIKQPKSGLEESIETFEKVSTMVKAIAPQVGGEAGFAGFIKGILTPEVGKALAAVVSGAPGQSNQQAMQAQQQVQQQPVQQQTTTGAPPQQPAPQQQQRDPNRPPNPPPQAVLDASKAFQLAMTPPVRAERFADFIIAMAVVNDPYYNQLLKPAMDALTGDTVGIEELKVARRLGMILVAEQKPDWATPDFVDSCIAALASKAGQNVPDALVKTAGAWTLDFRGNVLMLESFAKPVAPEPKPVEPSAPVDPAKLGGNPVYEPLTAEDLPAAQPLSAVPPERVKRKVELDDEKAEPRVESAQRASAVTVAEAMATLPERQPEPVETRR